MRVQNGIDRLDLVCKTLGKARIGLLTNVAAVSADLRPGAELLARHCRLEALFSPEHGMKGAEGPEKTVCDYVDGAYGVPVYSLYGKNKRPTWDMLSRLDICVVDLPDIGSRYFTYLSTLRAMIEECAQLGKEVVILDRLNPVNGVSVEGNLPGREKLSFLGAGDIPQRHGMTLGELTLFFAEEYDIDCQISVVPVKGWKREEGFGSSGLHWVNPSPNLPGPDAALLYNGTCLLEGTNLSEGRGTTRPFEIVGAPWLDSSRVAHTLNEQELPGVYFRPVWFEPSASKHQGKLCGGVQVHITDRDAIRPIETGLRLLHTLRKASEEQFEWLYDEEEQVYGIDLLAGTTLVREMEDPEEVALLWEVDSRLFQSKREPYLIYH